MLASDVAVDAVSPIFSSFSEIASQGKRFCNSILWAGRANKMRKRERDKERIGKKRKCIE